MIVAELAALFGFQVNKDSIGEVKSALESVTKLAKGFIAALGVNALAGFVEHAAEAGTHILGTATALGLSTGAFQEWSYVAKRAGTDANDLATGIGMFERNLNSFVLGGGSKRFKSAMAEMGISVADAKAGLAGPDGINGLLYRIADGYQRMGNTGQRAAINMGLFGARARGMAQDLSQGGAALKQQIDHLHAIGGVLSPEELAKLKGTNNAIVDLSTSWDNFKMRMLAAIAPLLIPALEGLERAVKAISDLFTAAFNGDEGAIAVVTGLAVAIGALVLPALASMAIAVVAATWPFLAIAAVVALITYGVLKLVKNWDAVSDAVKRAARWVRDEFQELIDWLDETFVQPLERAWDSFKNAATKAYNYVTSLDWAKAIPILGPLGSLLGHGAARALGGKEGGRDATSDDMGGMRREVLPDGSIVWHDAALGADNTAAPTRAIPGAAPLPVAGTVSTAPENNINAPLTVNINGVPNAERAVDGFDNVLQRQLRSMAATYGGAR